MKTIPGIRPEKALFAVLPLLLLALLLAGCELYGRIGTDDTNIQGALPELLRGEWVFPAPGAPPSERYIITGNTIQYISYNNEAYSYKGFIRFVSNFSAASGIIIIEYIDEDHRPSYPLHNGNFFFGIYFRNLGTNTVQLANSIVLADHSAPDTATLEEAISRFTRGRMGNYVNWGYVMPQWRVHQ